MRKIITSLILTLFTCSITAQNTTYSPSSMFGVGDLSTGEGGVYAGMGGVGLAMRSSNFLNIANPASLTEIGSRKYVIDIGVMGAYKTYKQSGITNNNVVGNINNLGFGFCVLPKWYAAVALTPISSVGYAITLEQPVEGTNGGTVSSLFEGDGGISKIGVSNAFQITPAWSVGVNLAFVTGSVTQTEQQGSASIEEVSEKRGFYADFGVQYKHTLARHKQMIIGAVYGPAHYLSQDNTLTVSSSSGGVGLEDSQRATRQYLPQFWGIGASYHSPRWLAAADYKYLDWSRMENSTMVSFDNQHRLSAGVGYIPGDLYGNYTQIQFGGGVSNSYVVISGKKANNFYLSTGLGFNFRDSYILSIGMKYSDQFNVSRGMQKERSFSLFLNIAFSERIYKAKLR